MAADGAGVPQGLVLVAAGVAPVDERLGVGQLDRLGVVLHHQQLGAVDLRGGRADLGRGDREQQVAHGRVVAELSRRTGA